MNKPKRIGYSFWGFLGKGVKDTPDGGRSHRPLLIKALIERGNKIIMLQKNRDFLEAGENIVLGQEYSDQFPEIDILFLEWRWLIPNRNDRKDSGYTPDLFRQREILQHYSQKVPVVVWDKDQQLFTSPSEDRQVLLEAKTYVLEPSLFPSSADRSQALFPFDPQKTSKAKKREFRDIDVIYIGNQYDREEMYLQYLVDAAN